MNPYHVLPLVRNRRAGLGVVLGLMALGTPLTARAHGDLDLQIAVVSLELKQTPTAALYLKRAELYHEHEDFAAALADYDRAAKLSPQLAVIAFGRARTLFKSHQLQPAREAIDGYLKQESRNTEAFLLRARILAALSENAIAVQDYDRCIALSSQPQPDWFLERADALVATKEEAAALKSLDEGVERLGGLITLQSAAIALEVQLRHYDEALARVDRVMMTLQRKEVWLTRRGEILEAAGRQEEARQSYRDALAALAQLPPQHRDIKPMRELQAQLQSRLGT